MIGTNRSVTQIKSTELPTIRLLHRRCMVLYTRLDCAACTDMRNELNGYIRSAEAEYCDVFEVQDERKNTTLTTHPTLRKYTYDSFNFVHVTEYDPTLGPLQRFLLATQQQHSSFFMNSDTARYNVYNILYTAPGCSSCDQLKDMISQVTSVDASMTKVREVVITSLNSPEAMTIVKRESITEFPTLVRYIRVGEQAIRMNTFDRFPGRDPELMTLLKTILNPMVSTNRSLPTTVTAFLQVSMRYLPRWDLDTFDTIGPTSRGNGLVISPSNNEHSLFATMSRVTSDVLAVFKYIHLVQESPGVEPLRSTYNISSILAPSAAFNGITIAIDSVIPKHSGMVDIYLTNYPDFKPTEWQRGFIFGGMRSIQYSPRYILSLHEPKQLLAASQHIIDRDHV